MIYFNADTDKSQILSDNKGKVGIYMWTHIESGRRYVGSAVDLSKRLGYHLHKSYLESFKGISYIYNVLLHYGHSVFSLSILEITYIQYLVYQFLRLPTFRMFLRKKLEKSSLNGNRIILILLSQSTI